ncbi:nucleotidyltransferase family protein [Planococcus sp. CAU13]|uniref:nucleotidyltransferase family protein n=1 Tax=Planococcus sp. CAU13 TaxID=1541197 RepID=UPI00053003B7|nr:nucleotidyltransferase family protein [Planococcus sp. CAU13]
METEKEILTVIGADSWMMKVLQAAEMLELSDWWICAGFVRSKVWDVLHGYDARTSLGDIDVIYYDDENVDEEQEKKFEHQLNQNMPGLPWSVKNQARMHQVNNLPQYQSSFDAVSQFPETATALGVKIAPGGQLELMAPHGLVDLLDIRVRPTPAFEKDERLMKVYKKRLESKKWSQKWPKVEVALPKEKL